jgi:hypothetical protein
MSLRKRRRIERYDYAHKCPACFAPMLLTFSKPAPGAPVSLTKTCIAPNDKLVDLGCGSRFFFIIKKSTIVGTDGVELPLTITRKVIELTPKGVKAYKAKTTHKLADKMGGGGF